MKKCSDKHDQIINNKATRNNKQQSNECYVHGYVPTYIISMKLV